MKKVLMFLALAGLSSAVWAQQRYGTAGDGFDAAPFSDKYRVITNRFGGNWFLSGGVGTALLLGDNDNAGKFGKRISPTIQLSAGKWFTPGMGLRLQYSGLQARGFAYDAMADYVKGRQMPDGYYRQRFNYMNLHGDVMFNLNALIGGYNPERFYEVMPYLGAGLTHNYSRPHRQALALNAGIINRFRLSDAFDLQLELAAMGTEDKFDGSIGGKRGYDGVLSASMGVVYRFPVRKFHRQEPPLVSVYELEAIREEMSRMDTDRKRLKSELAAAHYRAEEAEGVVVTRPDIVPRTVFFSIGSAEVSLREQMNLSYLADQMRIYPHTTYIIYGYADAATGTPDFNRQLSVKRAQAVADVLVKEYGIAACRLRTCGVGGVDSFGQPLLNRVVLVKLAE